MKKVSDVVFSFLHDKAVKHIFMLPGGGAMHLVDSLGKSGIEYIPFLHEQGAAIAAEAYGQHTNRPGVLLVTSGPGGTNAITGVTAGWIDSTPMFVISGQAKRQDLVKDIGVRQKGSQEVQIIPMVKPVTKYAVQVLEPEKILYYLTHAWREATTGRPGPVWLDIPLDVQGCMVDEQKICQIADFSAPQISVTKENGHYKEIASKVIQLFLKSKKPLILAGNGIKLSSGQGEFYALIDRLRVPVQTTWKAIDLMEDLHPLYAGHPGIMGDRGANLIIQESDLLLVIGSRLDTSITAFNNSHFAYHAKKILVDIDQQELMNIDMDTEEKICCDAALILEHLNRGLYDIDISVLEKADKVHAKWRDYCHTLRKRFPVITTQHKAQQQFVSCYFFIDLLCDYLRDDDIIVPESSGGAGEITYQAFRIKKGQKMKNAAGLGSMGFGLPYAIGSCIANNGRRTILINGDGAFQLNIQELETAHRLKLPLKMFIWCNHGYASIRSMQRNNFEGRYVGSNAESGLTIPDIGAVANAYGFQTCQIRRNEELKQKLPELLKDDRPLLCEVFVDPNECVSPRVKAYVGQDGQMRSGLLENMWPKV